MSTITREQAKQILEDHLQGRRAFANGAALPPDASEHMRRGYRVEAREVEANREDARSFEREGNYRWIKGQK